MKDQRNDENSTVVKSAQWRTVVRLFQEHPLPLWASVIILIVVVGISVWNNDASGPLGVGVSACGLLVAMLIFLVQRVDSNASEERTRQHISTTIAQYALGSEPEDEDVSDSEANAGDTPDSRGGVTPGTSDVTDDPFAASMARFLETAEGYGDDGGENVWVGGREDIPLDVLGDFVGCWIQDGVPLPRVTDLMEIARKQGKGNHPWFLTLERQPGEPELWKLTKGGRGLARGMRAVQVDIEEQLTT